MTSAEASPLEAALIGVGARLTAIEQTLQQFDRVLWALLALAGQAPVHLAVERLEVERLEFRVDTIDVEQLSGEMNVGLTSVTKLCPAEQPGGRVADLGSGEPVAAPAPPPETVAPHTIWPPTPPDETAHAGGE